MWLSLPDLKIRGGLNLDQPEGEFGVGGELSASREPKIESNDAEDAASFARTSRKAEERMDRFVILLANNIEVREDDMRTGRDPIAGGVGGRFFTWVSI